MSYRLLKPFISRFALLSVCLVLGACSASYIENRQLQSYDVKSGYRFPEPGQANQANSDSLYICLAFSGGGTRAAAFSYGILEKLRDTTIVWKGKKTRLLDEVDCISGISGGSFTAAYYGLYGDRIFKDYRSRFLERDVQHELFMSALNPLNWPRLASPKFNRIDLATELYDDTIFDHHTFADLIHKQTKPYIILHATNLASGERFEFTQDEFDLLGSDLATFPVARAVTASSAFPFLLSPVTLINYPEPKNFKVSADIENGLASYAGDRRQWHWAVRQNDYLDKAGKPYVHLMDGGLSDNIGIRALENAFRWGAIRRGINNNRIEKFVILVVNAKTDEQDSISQNSVPPELPEVAYKTTTIALDNYSFESIETIRDLNKQRKQTQDTLAVCNSRLKACQGNEFPELSGKIDPVVIDLNFENIQDPMRRKQLLSLPTSFSLSEEAVKQLIDAGALLLDTSPEFQLLLKDLNPGSGNE
ncbi:MAG: patatin-like phospholipase family protein [Methylococcaceae bacterium]|nr:patatin-like phospholipase family protein [Methylococcaceae bacterium]